MPKLRDRQVLAASKQDQNERQGETAATNVKWSQAETDAVNLAIKKHGTFSIEPLAAAARQRSNKQVRARLKQLRREAATDRCALPIDAWLDRMQNALPTPGTYGRSERLDVAALSVPLQLAAREERCQADLHRRQDLSEVYEHLAHLVDGKIPPEPSPMTSRRLLALTHHLAALMKDINLSRHKRWVWCNKRLRRLKNEYLGAAEGGQPPPQEAVDLSLVPAELRGAMAGLLAPELNRLQIPPALLLNPLSAQLNEAATGEKHVLLSQPVHMLLADAKLRRWGVSWRKGKDAEFATTDTQASAARTSVAQTTPTQTSVTETSTAQTSTAQASTAQTYTAQTSTAHTSAAQISSEPPSNEPAQEMLSPPPKEFGLFATPGLCFSDSEDDCPPSKAPRLSQYRTTVTTDARAATADPDDPESASDGPAAVPNGSSVVREPRPAPVPSAQASTAHTSTAQTSTAHTSTGQTSTAQTSTAQTSTAQTSTAHTYTAQTSAAQTSSEPPSNEPAQENLSPPPVELGLFATPELCFSDFEDDCPPSKAPRLSQYQTTVTTDTRAATADPDDPESASDSPAAVPNGSSAVLEPRPPLVPSLEGSRPGRMTKADMREEPSFAVRRGGVRTYTRKQRLLPRQ